MADPRYAIPWTPPNLLPTAQFIAQIIQGERANKRSQDYLDFEREAANKRAERESAALARQKDQDDFNRGVAAFNAIPELQRRARQSPGAANLNPFGVNFEEGQDLAPGVEGPEPSPAAEAARFMMNPKAGQAEEPQAPRERPADALPYGVEGPAQTPEGEAERFASTDDLMDRAQENVQPFDPMTLAAANAAGTPLEPKKRLYMIYKGQRSEVPEGSDETTGFGEEYDAIYRKLVDLGEKPHDAMKTVAGQYKSDQLQMAMGGRQARGFEFKDRNREDTQAFTQGENEKYKLTFEQRKELANIMARAKMAAAGAGPVNPGLAKLVGMKEQGATDEEIYAEAAKIKGLSQKEVITPVQNVVRNAAAGERASQKREGLTATGPGIPPGSMWKNSQAATKGTQQVQRFHRVEERLKELIADVEQNGERIAPDSKQYVNRMSKAEAAAAALRPYNELSSTDASMAAERAIIGPAGAFGHGWILGADLTTLKRLLAEAQGQQRVNLETLLRPGGGSQLAPALGGPRGGQDGAHPSQAPVGETRQGPDGKTYRKVGPNNWQPVTE